MSSCCKGSASVARLGQDQDYFAVGGGWLWLRNVQQLFSSTKTRYVGAHGTGCWPNGYCGPAALLFYSLTTFSPQPLLVDRLPLAYIGFPSASAFEFQSSPLGQSTQAASVAPACCWLHYWLDQK